MEFKLDSFRIQNGDIFTTTDGQKYVKSRIRERKAYLKCLFTGMGVKRRENEFIQKFDYSWCKSQS